MRTRALIGLFCLAAGAAAADAAAADATAAVAGDAEGRRLDALKGYYLVNFAKLIEWPAAYGDVLPFCFMGGRGVYEALADAAGKRIGTRSLTLRSVHPSESVEGCALLYIDATVASLVRNPMNPANAPMLIVSDAGEFTQRGGMIELFNDGSRLRFRVNLDNARAVGLKVSSALLQLASSVEREHPK